MTWDRIEVALGDEVLRTRALAAARRLPVRDGCAHDVALRRLAEGNAHIASWERYLRLVGPHPERVPLRDPSHNVRAVALPPRDRVTDLVERLFEVGGSVAGLAAVTVIGSGRGLPGSDALTPRPAIMWPPASARGLRE